jgi:hypothetical protein
VLKSLGQRAPAVEIETARPIRALSIAAVHNDNLMGVETNK